MQRISDMSFKKVIKRNDTSIESKDQKLGVKNTKIFLQSVPSSFAILVNFGIDGRKRMLFSSHADDHQCGDKQIWDPFNNQCRQMYCSTHFTLIDFKCVEDKNAVSDQNNSSDSFGSFLDSSSKFVNITLGFTISKPVPDIPQWIEAQNKTFETEFMSQFANASSLSLLSSQRIANVTYSVPQFPNTLIVNFFLKEDNTTDDSFLVLLSSTVSQRSLSFSLFDNIVNAFSIHTIISEVVESFCGNDLEMPIWYKNSQFYMQTEDNITLLYVNETGRRYKPGQYLGNILYVQKIEMNDDSEANKVNISSNAVVCETQTLIDESCPRILLNRSEYEWRESNETSAVTLVEIKSNKTHDRFELAPNGVFVCLKPLNNTLENEESLQDVVEDILSTVLIIISIIALSCVLVTYLTFECLRSTINGFNTINLSLCIELMQILFLCSPYLENCEVAAILLHYMLLLTMSWSSVIAYDMYRTFVVRKFRTKHNNICKLRIIYLISANVCAAIVIIISIIGQNIDSVVSPHYGDIGYSSGCWIRNPLATFLYFGVPLIINILVNLILYLMTVCQVRVDLKTWSSLRKVTRIPSDSSNTSTKSSGTGLSISTSSSVSLTNKSRPNSMLIFTRLGALMGFTWIIALIIAVVPQKYEITLKVFSYIFVILNTSQGVVIFIAFLCNSRVAKLWKNLLKIKV